MATTVQDAIQTESPPPSSAVVEPTSYGPLVRSAGSAAMVLLFVKLAALLITANFVGAALQLGFFFGVFPYFNVIAPAEDFVTVVTFSTMAMVVAAAALLLRPAVADAAERQVVWGRMVGLAIAAETVGFEVLRHVISPPVVDFRWAWVTVFELSAAALLAGVALWRTGGHTKGLKARLTTAEG